MDQVNNVAIIDDFIIDRLNEVLIDDLNFSDSAINDLINKISIKIILNSLQKEDRIYFYNLVNEGSIDEIRNFVYKKIPNFNSKIMEDLQILLKDIYENP